MQKSITAPLYVVIMPTLAAAYLSPMELVALMVEAAVWVPDRLPVNQVVGFRGGRPLGLLGNVDVPAGWVPIYGPTPESARQEAETFGMNLVDLLGDIPEFWTGVEALGERIGYSFADVEAATNRFKDALAGAL